MIKSREIKWVGHVARMGKAKLMQRFGRKIRRRELLETLGVHRSIILKCILKK
jgi:hypothetical protein